MPKSLTTLLLGLFLAGPVWPQENEVGASSAEPVPEVGVLGDEADESASITVEQVDDVDEIDDSDLDEQTYEEDEDDFVPSEEIPVDQPIPFPSNI